jgi:hypothetical protein
VSRFVYQAIVKHSRRQNAVRMLNDFIAHKEEIFRKMQVMQEA